MINEKLPKEQNCSGCGACFNVCPVGAIKMEYSSRGYRVPIINSEKCIDCGLCTKSCPTFNASFENYKEPKFYSFCADDQTRKVSSSGGMFSVIAEYVFEKGGYVCGAAFDENMKLKHTIINSKEELAPLRGSKYLQSDMNDCYKQIKKLLEEGKTVFFVGTPCQVAGLYGVLKKNYDKLITADLICHGTPSQKHFDMYLKEIANGRKVVDVLFRSKRLGWACKGIIIKFEDGSEYIGKISVDVKDPYFEAFIKGMMFRRMCYNCKYNDYPRQGDFTIGDLWHSDKLDPKSNDKKGTSFVFLNNKKAENLFEKLTPRAKYYNEIHVEDYSKIPNRVRPVERMHPARARFLDLLKTHTFSEAFRLAYYGKYDIGLAGVMLNDNVGSILTYYGLYNALTEMGYSVLPIERPLDSALPVSEKAKAFSKKWLPAYSQPVQYESIFDMRKLNQVCDQFVVGSDQIYLKSMSEARNNCYFLQWADDSKNKVGYSCSFGGPGARGTDEYYKELKYYLNRFSFVSSREDDGVNLVNERLQLEKQAQWCIDPVFLCNPKKYINLAKAFEKERSEEYIGAYVIIPKPPIVNLLIKTREHFSNIQIPKSDTETKNIPIEVIGNPAKLKASPNLSKFKYSDVFPVGHALEVIYNSKFFVTDSFHGVCFSIIFRKDFLVIPRDFNDRFLSLLNRIGLSNRIITTNLSNLKEESFAPIDYDSVYKKLNAEIAICKEKLSDALKDQGNTNYTDMDILMKYLESQNEKIIALEGKLVQMQSLVNELQTKLESSEQ